MKKMGFLNEVLEEIKPDNFVYQNVKEMLAKINSRIRKLKIKAKAVAGGSIAKGNFIKDDHDIDLFVKFNRKYPSEKLSDYLAKILRGIKGMKAERIHGSRDYFRIRNKHNFEIVPVLDIKKANESKNVTDMSPLHVVWVNQFTAKKPRLNDEIRLAKQFCKAQHVYGAESYIRGFSGHVIDILVVYYGSFPNLVKNAAKWKEEVVIDFYNHYKGRAAFMLNKSKLGPLVVIDPVMPERNAAAAISRENFLKFSDASRRFVKKPSGDFFVRKEIIPEALRKQYKGKNVLCFDVIAPAGKEDVVGAKLVRALEYIAMQAEKNDFEIADSGWSWDRKKSAMFYFVVKNSPLPGKKIFAGPPLFAEEHVRRFKAKHKKTFVKGRKIYAEEKRKWQDFEKFVLTIAKNDFFSDKIEKINVSKT